MILRPVERPNNQNIADLCQTGTIFTGTAFAGLDKKEQVTQG
jgi:hypothetical protein